MTLAFVYDDGGRAAAGYKGDAQDCACRAIAIAAELPYQQVYELINLAAKSERIGKRCQSKSTARNGVHTATMKRIMSSLGWTWVPTMGIGTGCKVHLREGELPMGRIIVRVSKHFTTVIDSVIRDTWDAQRETGRCVYGYYIKI